MRRRSFLKVVAGSIGVAAYDPRAGYGAEGGRAEEGAKPADNSGSNDFVALARELAAEKRTVIGVLREPNFAGREVPASLRPEHFQEVWGSRKDVRVVLLDKDQIRSYSILFKGRMDVLVYPYGSLYPMDSFSLFTGDALTHFLGRGGAVLTTGGVPFAMPVSDEGRPALKDPVQPDGLSLNNELYERWVAPLGYKYYVHPFPPVETRVDQRYLPNLPGKLNVAGCPLGIVANNSSHEPVPKCAHGNVFPERYPARQVIPFLWGTDSYGQVLAVNGLLIQDFENGSRRIHLAHQAEPHPLSPSSATSSALMNGLLELLTNRLVAKEPETNYACFRQGESVLVRSEVLSFEPGDTEAELVLEIRGNGQTVDSHTESVRIPAKQSLTREWTWTPPHFETDEYEVSFSVRRHGQTVSGAENGFVVWNEEVARRGPQVKAQGKYFHLNGSESFLSGTNYYESTRGEIMWYRPNVKRVADDLRQMRACGVNYIRPHYHHLKWFKDYLLFQQNRLLPYFSSLEAVESPLPDERTWRIWDAYIYLCQKFGIVYGGDLFTLVPEEMGDPRGWFPLRESVYCPEKRAVEEEFLRQISLRYKNVPGIAWDLWNEPGVPVTALKGWTDALRATIEKTGSSRLITLGGGSGEELGDAIDYLGLHSGSHTIRDKVNKSARPAMMQEIYMDHPEDLPSELIQAEDMREGVLATVKNGYCGVAPWSWTRQQRLWQDSYEHDPHFRMESWDDRLGTHVHDDATLKPAGQVFRNLATLLRTVGLSDFDSSTGHVATDRGELIVKLKDADESKSYSLYHVSGDHCFAAMALGSASWNGKQLLSGPPRAYVYIFGEDRHDVLFAKRIFAKTEAPGRMALYGRSERPQSVRLVDLSPLGNKTLEPLQWSPGADRIEITIGPNMQAYWVQLEW